MGRDRELEVETEDREKKEKETLIIERKEQILRSALRHAYLFEIG